MQEKARPVSLSQTRVAGLYNVGHGYDSAEELDRVERLSLIFTTQA